MPFAAFYALASIITHFAAMASGLNALTVQDGGGRAAAFGVGLPDQRAQGIVERFPPAVPLPLPEDMEDRFPRRKVRREITPRDAAFHHVEDSIQNPPAIGGRSSAFGGRGYHGLEIGPLLVGQAGLI